MDLFIQRERQIGMINGLDNNFFSNGGLKFDISWAIPLPKKDKW
jgi:hypothetical protein